MGTRSRRESPINARRRRRKSGGQAGHEGTTLRQVATPDKVIEYVPPVCPGCGGALSREQATGHQKRQVFDLPEPGVEVTEHRAYSGWCQACGTETQAAFPAEVRAAAQYGATVEAVVVYLQAWQLIPEDRLAELMGDVFGVEVATCHHRGDGAPESPGTRRAGRAYRAAGQARGSQAFRRNGLSHCGRAAMAACRLHLAADVLPHVGQARRDAGRRAWDHRP